MAVLTITEIQTEIRKSLGGRVDFDSRMDAITNLSVMRIARKHDFKELREKATVQTAVTSDAEADKTINLPTVTDSRIRRIYSVRLLDPNGLIQARKLTPVLTSKWDLEIPEPQFYARGTPTHYTRFNDSEIELWRVPSAVFDVVFRYSKWPRSVVVIGGGGFLDIDAVEDLVINLSASYLMLSSGREEPARMFFNVYRNQLKDATGEDEEDFEAAMSAITSDNIRGTKGVDDPFVFSTVPGD